MLFPLLISSAFAQPGEAPSLYAQTFQPTANGHWVRLRDTIPSADREFSWRSTFSYSHKPLEYEDYYGNLTTIVGGLTELNLAGAYRMGRTHLGLHLPIQVHGGGDLGSTQLGLGSPSIDAQMYLLDGATTAALGGRLGLPNGQGPSESLSAPVSGTVDVAVGRTLNQGWSLNGLLGAHLQPSTNLENANWGSRLRFGLGAMQMREGRARFFTELTAEPQFQAFGQTGTELLLGTELAVGPQNNYRIRPAFVAGLTDTPGTPRYRVLVQARKEAYVMLDTDGDGLSNDVDNCPSEPEDLDGYEDSDGCPEPTLVTLQVEDYDGYPIEDGTWGIGQATSAFSEAIALEAGEHSVIVIDKEHTIRVPQGEPVAIKFVLPAPRGTLVVHAIDANGQPIVGATWTGTGENLDTGEQDAGSPAQVRPGQYKLVAQAPGYRNATGLVKVTLDAEATLQLLMAPSRASVTGERIDIKDSVYFETAKDVIKEQSFELLNEVAELIVAHPELTLIRIEGHTDNRGNADYNRKLSQARADSVRQYLMSRGVSENRLESIGYGEDKPLDNRNVAEAWEKNRRVDFMVAERAEVQPTAAPEAEEE